MTVLADLSRLNELAKRQAQQTASKNYPASDQSQRFSQSTSSATGPTLPTLHRGLAQIEALSQRIATKALLEQDGLSSHRNYANGYLTNVGIDTSIMSDPRSTNIDRALRPIHMTTPTDVPANLSSLLQQDLLKIISDNQAKAKKVTEDVQASRDQRSWHTMRSQMLKSSPFAQRRSDPFSASITHGGSFGQSSLPFTGGHPGESTTTHRANTRAEKYLDVIRTLNEARSHGNSFPLAKGFADAIREEASLGMEGQDVVLMWDILAAVLCEGPSTGRPQLAVGSPARPIPLDEGAYATSARSFETKTRLVRGARSILEEAFREHMDVSIRQRRMDALLGGQPGALSKVLAYIRTLSMPQLHMMEERSEKWDGEWVWAVLYYLIRAGALTEAVSYVESHQAAFCQAHPAFPSLLQAYVRTNGYLGPEDRSRLQEYFHRHLRHTWERGDVHRFLVYKVLGRCDLRKRTFSEVIDTTDDYMWLQFMLITEGNVPPSSPPTLPTASPHRSGITGRSGKGDLANFMLFSDSLACSKDDPRSLGRSTSFNGSVGGGGGDGVWGEEYTLEDLQSGLRALGPKHYAPSSRPLLFPQLLLYTGQFGQAVQYLQSLPGHEVDAMHLLITCAYYGVLGMIFTPVGLAQSKGAPGGAGSSGKFGKTLPFSSTTETTRARPTSLLGSTSGLSFGAHSDLDNTRAKEDEGDQGPAKVDVYEGTKAYVEAVAAYARWYEGAKSVDAAMQYLYLLLAGKPYGTTGDVEGDVAARLAASPEWKSLLELCHSQIRHLLIRSRQYPVLLGRMDVHGNTLDGELTPAKLLLLGLQGREELADRITRKVAQWCQEHGRVVEAVRLYSLTQDYDWAVRVMVRVMGEVLMTPRYDRDVQDASIPTALATSGPGQEGSSPMGKAEEVMSMAAELSAVYGANGEIRRKVSPSAWRTMEILLSLSTFIAAWRAQQWEAALNAMLKVGLFPLLHDAGTQGGDIPGGWWMRDGLGKSQSGMSEEAEMEEAVGRNIPALLVATMEVLCGLYNQVRASRFGEAIRLKEMARIKRMSQALMAFSGRLRIHLNGETYSSLNRLEIQLE
ncbi:Nup93/Nic96-domain-containing protein [Piptocephalis cylindrospora]|uniref:Nup93/Nic96-domain-containing protein n=1 Tax=Piptocephalis cylindrospora TaxID=1907219 RepID=A0A4P9Y7U7_9FUNG|nr:Nup93/Nic96-domain-containing protein [Piptocephalis cylindrospora]|eukprot:RKP15226.1 Nup93/Nic96-domain-containing protein [Piptocephalis cylindrospora]